MRRFPQRFPSLLARNVLHSPANFRHSNSNHSVIPIFHRATHRFVFFSSQSDSARGLNSDEDVSKEELKKRIQNFWDDGDKDAFPDLMEALMIRKLSGKHDDSDDEVMEEVRKYPVNDAHKLDDSDSDSENDGHGDSSDSDFDSDSSDSDLESDGLRDDDSADSDIESDGLKAAHSSCSDSESD